MAVSTHETGTLRPLREEALGIELRFVGKSCDDSFGISAVASRSAAPGDREAFFRRLVPTGVEPAWLEQIHSAEVAVAAAPGCAGRGDGLVTRRRDLALCVVTADCVPVLFAGTDEVGAAHAGWRGLVAGVLGATLERMTTPAAEVVAWIGPAIGPCCYEVGEEVAAQVAAASAPRVVRPGPAGKPHLDLPAAAAAQLAAAGVVDVRRVEACTRCDAERWWSYRRDGGAAGRNVAMIRRG